MTDHTPDDVGLPTWLPMTDYPPETWAGRERIVACLQACDDIPTEQLGNVKALVDALDCLLGYHKKAQARTQLGRGSQQAVSKAEVALAPFRED